MVDKKAQITVITEIRRSGQVANAQEFVPPRELLNHFRDFGSLWGTVLANQNLPIAKWFTGNAVEKFRKLPGSVEGWDADGESYRHFPIVDRQ